MKMINSAAAIDVIYALGWTIIHSLWQSMLVAALLWVTLKTLKSLSSRMGYLLSSCALLLCVAWSIETFYTHWVSVRSAHALLQGVSRSSLTHFLIMQSEFQRALSVINQLLPWLVLAWVAGVFTQLLGLGAEYLKSWQLKYRLSYLAEASWQSRLSALASRLNIKRQIELRISNQVECPCVLGHFKPVVFLPASLLLQLPIEAVEAILLHELAHIRRNDYIVGLLQAFVKTLFFFNPWVHWISNHMDSEREHVCDELAVGVCKDTMFYAKTLSAFAEMQLNQKLMMAANPKNRLLLPRIKRLLVSRRPARWFDQLTLGGILMAAMTMVSVYAQHNSTPLVIQSATEVESPRTVPAQTEENTLGNTADKSAQAFVAQELNKLDSEQNPETLNVGGSPDRARAVTNAAENTKGLDASQGLSNQQSSAAVGLPVEKNEANEPTEKVTEVPAESAQQDNGMVVVIGALPEKRKAVNYFAQLDSSTASNCNFTVTENGDHFEDEYLVSLYGYNDSRVRPGVQDNSPYGNAKSSLAVPAGCRASDMAFAAGRHRIQRNDHSLADAYAAYESESFEEALDLFKKSYKKMGYDAAGLMLGDMYLMGIGTSQNIAEAIDWYKQVADARYNAKQESPAAKTLAAASIRVQAQIRLVRIYLQGVEGVPELRLAKHWLQEASKLQYAPAAFMLGKLYSAGVFDKNKTPDEASARKYYALSAELNYGPALLELAEYYAEKESSDAGQSLALRYYWQAYNSGYSKQLGAEAQFRLAHFYHAGIGVNVDAQKALVLYKSAAIAGHSEAQAILATYFYEGEVVGKDLRVARRLFEVAAENGQLDAMYNLGVMTLNGEGGEQNKLAAQRWLKQAAEHGHERAQQALNVLNAMAEKG